MKESIVLYPAPGSHQIISMVELAKLISQHHPNLPITILLTTSTPFETSTTSSSYINLISSDQNQTNPNLPISFFTLPSLHLRQSHIENPVESAIEFMRLNIPNVLQALETISQSSKVLAFITSSVHHPYDPQIPTYFYFTSCASVLALFLYLPTIHNQTPKSFRDLNDAVLHFPGLPPLRASQMPLPLLDLSGPAYEYFLNFAACLPKSQGIITNTFQALEPSAIKAISAGSCVPNHQAPPIFHIGPLNFDAKNRASSACEDRSTSTKCLMWLDEQPSQSVVFLCFGSRGAFSVAQLSEIAMGLERSKQRFLWVVRSPPGSSSVEPDLEILLTKEFLERTKNRGLVVKSWAPQAAILRHGCVGGFVTHCGWNSVLEAVTYGVPMAAWPLYAEQAVNGVVLVEEMKLGIPVESKEGFVSAEEVEKKVSMLMDGKSLRLPSTEAARDIHVLIPVWWRWYYWGSPIAWTIYGIFASQFGDIKTVIDTPQGPQRVDLYLKENLGHEHDFVIPVFFAHIGWVLLFFFVFAYGIKFLKLHSAAELSDLQDVK